ncbi:hypothetical protein [Blastopirellula retiformator]|uniref:Uncharacterized protein n=1 Tax=Blastopirellula retiformator TaxID=2527970 RepID=A0A5C5UYC4_9BACT|nr:hypothetical protein [Blastopirellula retiformator]TWT31344.1 hypothetical protein Enr8_32640 [Blastopirellula retiformator]
MGPMTFLGRRRWQIACVVVAFVSASLCWIAADTAIRRHSLREHLEAGRYDNAFNELQETRPSVDSMDADSLSACYKSPGFVRYLLEKWQAEMGQDFPDWACWVIACGASEGTLSPQEILDAIDNLKQEASSQLRDMESRKELDRINLIDRWRQGNLAETDIQDSGSD